MCLLKSKFSHPLTHQSTCILRLYCIKNCVVLEKTLESPLDCKEIKPVNPKGHQPWIFIRRTDAEISSNTLATWCQETTDWKTPCCWERLKAGGEGDDQGWNGWMASPTRWTWVWASSGRWWWSGKLVCCTQLSVWTVLIQFLARSGTIPEKKKFKREWKQNKRNKRKLDHLAQPTRLLY